MELVKYEAARRALVEAKSVDEVKNIHDVAAAMKAYARQANDKEMEITASEIRIRAERRLGEIIRKQKETVGLAQGGQPYQSTGTQKEPVEKSPTLADVGINKKLSSRAQKIASIPEKKYEDILSEHREKQKAVTSETFIKLTKESEKEERKKEYDNRIIKSENTPTDRKIDIFTTDKKYRILYVDPPWEYDDKQDNSNLGGASKHYNTMSVEDLCNYPVPRICEKNSVLFLWVTSPKLNQFLQIMKAWGFGYKTSFVWDKIDHNMGHYNSVRHEFLLIGGKGKSTPDIKKLHDSVISIKKSNIHSEKPIEFMDIIDELYIDGNRIEGFCRFPQKKTWDYWGNEV